MIPADFRKAVEAVKIPPVVFLAGEDEYLRRDITDALKKKIQNVEHWDGEEQALAEVLASAEQMMLGGGARLLIVRNADKLLADDEALTAYLQNPSPDAVLVFCVQGLDARKKSTRAIEKHACIVELSLPKASEWGAERQKILQRFPHLSFERQALDLLWDWSGEDLGAFSKEMEKLAVAYPEKKSLAVNDVEALVFRQETQNVFDWVNAVAAGRRKEAMELLLGLAREGTGTMELLGLLRSQGEKLYAAADMLAQGKPVQAICQALRVPPFFGADFIARAKKISVLPPRRFFAALLECEKSVKTGLLKDNAAGEMLVVKLGRS